MDSSNNPSRSGVVGILYMYVRLEPVARGLWGRRTVDDQAIRLIFTLLSASPTIIGRRGIYADVNRNVYSARRGPSELRDRCG